MKFIGQAIFLGCLCLPSLPSQHFDTPKKACTSYIQLISAGAFLFHSRLGLDQIHRPSYKYVTVRCSMLVFTFGCPGKPCQCRWLFLEKHQPHCRGLPHRRRRALVLGKNNRGHRWRAAVREIPRVYATGYA